MRFNDANPKSMKGELSQDNCHLSPRLIALRANGPQRFLRNAYVLFNNSNFLLSKSIPFVNDLIDEFVR